MAGQLQRLVQVTERVLQPLSYEGPQSIATETYIVPKSQKKQNFIEWHNNLLDDFLE